MKSNDTRRVSAAYRKKQRRPRDKDVTTWLTNSCNTLIAQYLKK